MDVVDFLEWGSYIGALLTVWLYGFKNTWGPKSGLITAAAFVLYGILADIPVAVLTNIVFAVLHYNNLRKVND